MIEFPSKSPLQFHHLPDGQVQLADRPDVTLKIVGGRASAEFPEWERTLGLPTYQEEWEAMALVRGVSNRFVTFVLVDESETKHVGNWRFQPAHIRWEPANYLFTLGHTGFVIGGSYALTLHAKDPAPGQWKPPDFVEGDCLIGYAQLYDSPLADVAWRGLQQGIFTHTCAVIAQEPGEAEGVGALAEIALTSEAEAACLGARILRTWPA